MPSDITSKSLQGITDLTLVAPIKQGLLDTLDTRTYASRLRTLMMALNGLRVSSREFAPIRPFSDTVERVQAILSFRVAILVPEQKVLLAVTFDRPWEPYIRLVWGPLGPLLDVIFCNCEGYVTACEHTFDEYAAWIRSCQVDSNFFYAVNSMTVTDLEYLRQTERLHRETRDPVAADLANVRMISTYPEATAQQAAAANVGETVNQGLTALSTIFKLGELYPPDRPDGVYLLRAARELLRELWTVPAIKAAVGPGSRFRLRFGAQLEWFEGPLPPRPGQGVDRLTFSAAQVQSGIVKSNADHSHGCVVLLRVRNPAALDPAALIEFFLRKLGVTSHAAAAKRDSVHVNVAFTYGGLQRLGLPAAELAKFPKEFRDGMEARAGLLGDFRGNHPRNWSLPARNWPSPAVDGGLVSNIQISMIDVMVQMRVKAKPVPGDHELVGNPDHPLFGRVTALSAAAEAAGLEILCVETMLRSHNEGFPLEHFGFSDGVSQPVVPPKPVPTGTYYDDNVSMGEVLLGYRNDRKDPAPAADPLFDNGSFLVVRKLAQDVAAFNAFLEKNAGVVAPEILKTRMMGRAVDGKPLVTPVGGHDNDFNYAGDPTGAQCPFQSHVRRANPRHSSNPNLPLPRIMRRGMAYGPRFDVMPAAKRGLMFMAYNTSIAEQFEIIQRWVAGANATDIYSGQGDPILGVPRAGDARTFRFEHDGKVVRVELDDPDKVRPFVSLEWGAYLFAPSMAALAIIATAAASRAAPSDAMVRAGEATIAKMKALEAAGVPAAVAGWKSVLEDLDSKLTGVTASVWAAIRFVHGGILQTPYGTLVASRSLVREVFDNSRQRYSVKGYTDRMKDSIGPIYLGLDEGEEYARQSAEANQVIATISEEAAFSAAQAATRAMLTGFLGGGKSATFDVKEISDKVLASLSTLWFDVPGDGAFVAAGGWDARAAPARCPGHFTSPSRYIFSPNPGKAVKGYGDAHGAGLRAAVKAFVSAKRGNESTLQSAFCKTMFPVIADDDALARTIVGAMMGFLPTVDGNLRTVMYAWLAEGTLWRLQDTLLATKAGPAALTHAQAGPILKPALVKDMQRMGVPDMVWRTATVAHTLGTAAIAENEKIVVGIGSAMQDDLGRGIADVSPVFGGDRSQSPHPTHACPGYSMGMGVMLGIVCAILEAGTLRPTPAPLTFTLTVA